MRDYQEKQGVREFIGSKFVLSVLFFIIIVTGIASFKALERNWLVERERKTMEEDLKNLQERKGELTDESKDLSSGQGIEREARDKLNYRKPGEEVVIIKENKPSEKNISPQTTSRERLWSRILGWLGF